MKSARVKPGVHTIGSRSSGANDQSEMKAWSVIRHVTIARKMAEPTWDAILVSFYIQVSCF